MLRTVVAVCATLIFAGGSVAESPGDPGGLELLTSQRFETVIEEHRGRFVVLNLWATWCVPCLREIPDLMRLESELSDRNVSLLAVGMDDPYDFARVDAFRREHFPAFFSYLRDTPDMDSMVSVIDPVWNELLPTTYLLDANGEVVRRIQGKKTYAEFHELVSGLLE